MSAYADWVSQVQGMMTDLGYPAYASTDWAVVTWPSTMPNGHVGEPALQLSNAAYTDAFNAGYLPTGAGTEAAPSGKTVYVLASTMTGSDDVVASSPHTMTAAERALNASFTGLDKAATAAGLPSLNAIESFLKGVGRDVLVGVAVTVVVGYLLTRKR